MCEHIKNTGESGVLSDGMTRSRNVQIPHLLKFPKEIFEEKEHTAENLVIMLHFLLDGTEAPNHILIIDSIFQTVVLFLSLA